MPTQNYQFPNGAYFSVENTLNDSNVRPWLTNIVTRVKETLSGDDLKFIRESISDYAEEKKARDITESIQEKESPGLMRTMLENELNPINSYADGFNKTYNSLEWGDSFKVTRQMIKFDKFNEAASFTDIQTSNYYETRLELLAAAYGNAMAGNASFQFSGTTFDLTTSDGQPLFSTTHRISKQTTDTWANAFSDPLTPSNINKAIALMSMIPRSNGLSANIVADTVQLPNIPSLTDAAQAALLSHIAPGVTQLADGTVTDWHYGRNNAARGRLDMDILANLNNYLSGVNATDAPWLVTSKRARKSAQAAFIADWEPLTINVYKDDPTRAYVYQFNAMFRPVFASWKFATLLGISSLNGTATQTMDAFAASKGLRL